MKYVGQCLSPIVLGIFLLHFDLDTVFMLSGSFGLLVALITYSMKNIFQNSGNEHIKEKEAKISLPH